MQDNAQDSVTKLDGEPAVSRVIIQDEVKLYRARLTVAYLDGGVYDFGPTSVSFAQQPTPVYNDEHQAIGFAALSVERTENGRRIVAEVTIDYATPERLLAETQSEKLYPWIFGSMRMAQIPLFDFQARLVPMTLVVHGVQFSRLRPTDERVGALGWPEL